MMMSGWALVRNPLGLGKHDLDLDTNGTLAHGEVAGGDVQVVLSGLTSAEKVTVTELLGLSALGTQLAGDDDLATAGTRLHNVAEDTEAGTADGETHLELVAERLKHDSIKRNSPVEPRAFTPDLSRRLRALYAQ
eukprot:gnl/Ergobibamus_cyprinoides/2314.p1 GENE.gnl/Ergobibamus_cyprinoides/2314~~gnl/Ergobibamus_cyprinoides/2314.p1  ORF type:complete len:135 (-),score=5.39 gnl/Ergobibamus_cyprinoides/2314:180-584(-)